jgi:hypothetical protein
VTDAATALIHVQFVEAGGLADDPVQLRTVNQQRLGRQDVLIACDRVVIALEGVLEVAIQPRPDLGRLGHEGLGAAHIVEQAARPIAVSLDHLAERHDLRVLHRADRSLGRRVVAADRLDVVADELDADRLGIPGQKQVHDAAADAELPVGVHRVLAGEPRVDEQAGQAVGIDLAANPEVDRGSEEALGRAHAREQRSRRRDHDTRGAACRRVQRRARADAT